MDYCKELFNKLDNKLIILAKSDSSIEYAPHIRDSFNDVINELNNIKIILNIKTKTSNSYFK